MDRICCSEIFAKRRSTFDWVTGNGGTLHTHCCLSLQYFLRVSNLRRTSRALSAVLGQAKINPPRDLLSHSLCSWCNICECFYGSGIRRVNKNGASPRRQLRTGDVCWIYGPLAADDDAAAAALGLRASW